MFLYEWIVAGDGDDRPPGPTGLETEGAAMLSAIAGDLARIPELCIHTLVGGDLLPEFPANVVVIRRCTPNGHAEFARCVAECDAALLIAPEFSGELLRRVRYCESRAVKLLSPDSAFVELASDKQRTATWLADAGVPVPEGFLWNRATAWPSGWRFPLVAKPCDGAGSIGVQWIESPEELPQVSDADWRIERFCSGTPASVAVLCGDGRPLPLAPCAQQLGGSSGFEYRGGHLPLPDTLADRARDLVMKALAALPPTTGYVGLDLILGDAPDGIDDVVVEVNPRLTTSYVGLRRATKVNLAAVMLERAYGGGSTGMEFAWQPVDFAANGTVSPLAD